MMKLLKQKNKIQLLVVGGVSSVLCGMSIGAIAHCRVFSGEQPAWQPAPDFKYRRT